MLFLFFKDVYILQRLNVTGRILHRSCFRCARCKSQLSIANYYETEKEGIYCCEMCPDEENVRETEIALSKITLERNKKLDISNSDADEEESSDENNDRDTISNSGQRDENPLEKVQEAEDESSLPESQQNVEEKLVVTIVSDNPDGSINSNAIINIDTVSTDSMVHGQVLTESLPPDESINKLEIQDSDKYISTIEVNPTVKENIDTEDICTPMLRPECDQIESKGETCEDNTDLKLDTADDDSNRENKSYDDESNCDNQTSELPSISIQSECKMPLEKENILIDEIEQKTESNKIDADAQVLSTPSNQCQEENEVAEISYPSDMNPFGEDESVEEEKPIISITNAQGEINLPEQDIKLDKVDKKVSSNPFASDFEESDEEDAVKESKPTCPSTSTPNGPPKPPRTPVKQSLNPFGSDFEDEDEDLDTSSKNVTIYSNSRSPGNYENVTLRSPSSPALSTTSRASSYIAGRRKKRPAPPPPSSNITTRPSPQLRTAIDSQALTKEATTHASISPTPAPRTSKLPSNTDTSGLSRRPPPRPPPPNSISSSYGHMPKSRNEKDNLNRRSQCMMQMNQNAVIDGSLGSNITPNLNLGSAGTSDADSYSIMSGSITSTR